MNTHTYFCMVKMRLYIAHNRIKSENMKWYKCKKYGIKVTELSGLFGYKNPVSFRNVRKFRDIMNGVEGVIDRVEGKIMDNLKK